MYEVVLCSIDVLESVNKEGKQITNKTKQKEKKYKF